MKIMVRLLVVTLLVMGVTLPSPGAESSKPGTAKAVKKDTNLREWKSASGATIEAAYVEAKYSEVTLRGADGKLLVISLYRLSPEDRAYVAKLQKAEKSGGGIKEPKAPNRLPVFAAGKWINCHAVYEADTFDATMDSRGVITVYPKEGGKRIGKPMTISMSCYYTKKTMHGRGIIRFTKPPRPQMQPKEITFEGTLRDDVPFGLTFEFSDKGIRSYGYCEDPQEIEFPTVFRVGARVPPSHSFGNDVPLDERSRILEGWQVVVKRVSGKDVKYDYSKPRPRMGGVSERVTIDAPVYGKREIRFKAGDAEDAPLRPYVYGGYCPYQGYYVGMYKTGENAARRSSGQYFEIEVR